MSSGPALGGRYRLLDRLGGGGMSVVWRGYDQVLGRTVAVKVLATGTGSAAGLVRTEARTAAQLSHPHVCQVYDYGEARTESGDHVAYLVMELLTGPTLEDRLRESRLPVRTALRVAAQIASGLAAAHGCGLVHRDIKPANVMMTPTGPKVVDFGIAATAGAPDGPVAAGEVWGTPAYLAPERWTDGTVTPASDVYALGIVLYRMVSGTVPWQFATVTEMLRAHRWQPPAPLPTVEGLPEAVADLCRRCLAKDPDQRPTAHELARVLAESVGWRVDWAGGRLIESAADTAGAADAGGTAGAPEQARNAADEPAPGPDPVRRYRRRLLVLATAGVLAVAAVVVGEVLTGDSRTDRPGADAVAAGGPSPGTPAAHPTGSGSPQAGAADQAGGPAGPGPAGGGTGPDGAPGGTGPATADPAPGPPGVVAPQPGGDASPPPAGPGGVTEEVETAGGTVLARCVESTASVEPLELAPGWRVVDRTSGPGVVRAGILLGSGEDRVRVDVRCRAGQPVTTVSSE